jgi:hypothetical protein
MTEWIKSVRDLMVYMKAFDAAMRGRRWKMEDGSNCVNLFCEGA